MKNAINPMQSAHNAPRCSAHSKRSGLPCKSAAVKGWKVCRMHGARSGAPAGKDNGRYKHGANTKSAKAAHVKIKLLLRECDEVLDNL